MCNNNKEGLMSIHTPQLNIHIYWKYQRTQWLCRENCRLPWWCSNQGHARLPLQVTSNVLVNKLLRFAARFAERFAARFVARFSAGLPLQVTSNVLLNKLIGFAARFAARFAGKTYPAMDVVKVDSWVLTSSKNFKMPFLKRYWKFSPLGYSYWSRSSPFFLDISTNTVTIDV